MNLCCVIQFICRKTEITSETVVLAHGEEVQRASGMRDAVAEKS